jgi:hypothetical protein
MAKSLADLETLRNQTEIDGLLEAEIEKAIIKRKRPFSRLGLLGGCLYHLEDFDPASEVYKTFQRIEARFPKSRIDADHCWYPQVSLIDRPGPPIDFTAFGDP